MRSVVVTGSSSGIGKACALRLDAEGWRVFAGVRKAEDGSRLRDESSERLEPVLLDVTDEGSIRDMVAHVSRAVGDTGLHGLVNNAGIATGGVLESVPLLELRKVLEVNVTGQLAVTQPLIPLLRRARGRIVMMSSISGRSALPLLGLYSASKHALEALTDALRLELHPWGIRVAAVQPGTIATPIWGKASAFAEEAISSYPAETMRLYGPLIQALRDALPKIRGTPAEKVADAVSHALTSGRPKSRYLVGRDAHVRAWIERLPTWLRDRVLLSRLPAYGR
jgi:NAD(P)-dependent dehydrogenase (short-subunit alcohol dehydrogenase family)